MNKRRKAKRKRWMNARVRAYRRAKFVEAFRECFVKKGIL